jgi:hypothetical protein
MSRIPAPPIVTCHQWGAASPKARPIVVGKPDKIVIHHTDGHAPLTTEHKSVKLHEAIAYARMLQNMHMNTNGWNDSGHNFLVCRSGIILQGRWGTVTAIEHGRMVMSAHCPGQNDNPGIEHEHMPNELFTKEQLAATVWLMAWICDRTGIRNTALFGHDVFYNTACPSNLKLDIPSLRVDVAKRLNAFGRAKPVTKRSLTVKSAVRSELKPKK